MSLIRRAPLSGVDLTAPGGLEALFAYHRARFGDAVMMADGDPGATPAPAPEAPLAASATPPLVTTTATVATPDAPEASQVPQRVEELPEWAQKEIRKARQEAGDQRTAKNAAEQDRQAMLDGIAKALGIKPDDAPPDPAALQSTIAESQARITALEADTKARDVELAAWRAASKAGANAPALLDSRSFVAELGGLDPSADDFGTRVDTAVKKALEANPALRANPLPTAGQVGIGATGSSGADAASPGMPRLVAAYASSPNR